MKKNPPFLLTKKSSIIAEAEKTLADTIDSRLWIRQLPPERELCDLLGVSRTSLRAALRVLEKKNVLRIRHGKKTEILKVNARRVVHRGTAPENQRVILLITSIPERYIMVNGAFWLEDFRQMMAATGHVLINEVITNSAGQNLRSRMDELRQRHHPVAWLLVACEQGIHQMMHRLGWPAMIGGTPFPECPLPGIDIDYRAACRHAVGHLAALGHRRIALLAPRSALPGDQNAIGGFQEGIEAHQGGALDGVVLKYQPTAESVHRVLRQEMHRENPATALVICRPQAVISALTVLAAFGKKVPRDVSVIARDYNPAMREAVWPPIDCYRYDPAAMARRVVHLYQRLISKTPAEPSQLLIIPDHLPGASTARVFASA